MFRFSSLGGALIDEILSASEKSKTLKKLFKQVEQDGEKSHFRLVGENCNLLVGVNDIQYSIDNYDSKVALDPEIEIEKFVSLFSVINNTLKVRDVRRIGMVCEYRIASDTDLPSRELTEKLTKLKPEGFPAKFQLQFEQRHAIAGVTGIPDFRTDDFWNVIESIYDGEIDADHSASRQINFMLDVQRYYKPLLEDKIDNAIRSVAEKYKKQYLNFSEKVKALGLVNGN